MWPNPQFTADLLSFTEKILNCKLCFLCSDCVREGYLCNKCFKIKGKRIHNSAICNKPEEKKTTETAWNLSSTDKEKILLPTAEVYVANERNNNSANEECNGSDRAALEKTLALILY